MEVSSKKYNTQSKQPMMNHGREVLQSNVLR